MNLIVLIINLRMQIKLKIRKKPNNNVVNENLMPTDESEVIVNEDAACDLDVDEVSSSEGFSELVSSESLESQSLLVIRK